LSSGLAEVTLLYSFYCFWSHTHSQVNPGAFNLLFARRTWSSYVVNSAKNSIALFRRRKQQLVFRVAYLMQTAIVWFVAAAADRPAC